MYRGPVVACGAFSEESEMEKKTPEQLRARADALRKKLGEKGGSMDAAAVRALKKKVRRAQRRRRVLVATAARRAASGKEKKEA